MTATTTLLALAAVACGSSDSDTRELTGADYACDAPSDCAIRAVPQCCGEQVESVGECVNAKVDLPRSADCSGNQTCAARFAVSRCDCVKNDLFPPYDDPDHICVGLP